MVFVSFEQFSLNGRGSCQSENRTEASTPRAIPNHEFRAVHQSSHSTMSESPLEILGLAIFKIFRAKGLFMRFRIAACVCIGGNFKGVVELYISSHPLK